MIGYGKKIRRYREENNLTQEDLAKIWGIAPSTIAMYENEEREPRRETKIKIANTLKQSIEKIFF